MVALGVRVLTTARAIERALHGWLPVDNRTDNSVLRVSSADSRDK